MADETAEQIIARLERDLAAQGQRDAAAAAGENESAESIIARLNTASRPASPAGPWYREFPGQFNQSLANMIGLIGAPAIAPFLPAAPDSGQPLSTMEYLDERIGASRDATVGLFQRLGFIPEGQQAPSSIAGHIGAGLPQALAFGGLTIGGAPAVARAGAASSRPTAQAFGEIAEQIAQRPATTARSLVSSEFGMVAARETARPYVDQVLDPQSPNLLTQAARSALMFGIEMLGSIPTERLGRLFPVPRAERFSPMTPHSEPILSDVSNPVVAGQIARTRSVQFQDAIDRQLARVMERTAEPGLDEATAGRNLRGGLLAARDYAKSEVNRAWGEVDQSITGNSTGVVNAIEDMLAQARAAPAVADNFPVRILEAIRAQLFQGMRTVPGQPATPPTITPAGGPPWQPGRGQPPLTAGRVTVTPGTPGTPARQVPVWRDNVSVQELHDIRSKLLREADIVSETNVLQPRPNLVLAANINRLIDEITNSIEAIGSVDPRFQGAFDYARDATRLYFERFRRGPVGDLLMVTRQTPFATEGSTIPVGGQRIPATEFARQMLQGDETATAIAQAGQTFGRQLANPPLGGLAQGRVREAGDAAARTMFHKHVMDFFQDAQDRAAKPRSVEDLTTTYSVTRPPVAGAATRATQWLRENRTALEAWTGTTARIGQAVDRINRLLVARDAHTQSVLSQFIGRNATEVFEESLRAPNSAERFNLLYRSFKNNPQFLEGAQRALIDMVFAGRGADPNIALARLTQGNYSDALRALFQNDPAKLDRLYKMVRLAAETIGDTVSSTAAGGARIVPNKVKELLSPVERAARGTASFFARLMGLQAGGLVARMLPVAGGAAGLSIPLRWGRGASEYIAYQWLQARKSALDIVRDAVFDPDLEARLHDLAPNNYRDLQARNLQLNRYLRRLEAATNEEADRVLTRDGNRLYWQERRKIREDMARARKGPFAEGQ